MQANILVQFFKNYKYLFLILIFYFLSHFLYLNNLPVFADESIYIRWSQLIIDDPKQYLFFPMNDGKTPLFMWVLVPFQFLFEDQLLSARFVSVLIGAVQVVVIYKFIELFSLPKRASIFAGLLTTILPFWFFHHRMALIDGLLVLLFSLSYYFLFNFFILNDNAKINENVKNKITFLDFKYFLNLKNLLLSSLFLGLAYWTKIPAVLFLPAIFLLIFYFNKNWQKNIFYLLCVITLGTLIFISLRLHPTFGQLFSRGSDFLYPVRVVLFEGKWQETLRFWPSYFEYFYVYMTPALLLLLVFGLFTKKHKKEAHLFFWSGILFLLPIMILGKAVYPRYLFPATWFFTLSAVFAFESFASLIEKSKKQSNLQIFSAICISLIMANIAGLSFDFIIRSYINADTINFVKADRVQYLTEWSSGHGIKEVMQDIRELAKNQKVAVATEGYFGTLPDGLLLYMHRTNVDNIYLEGVGYPVGYIPKFFAEKSRNFEKKLLVVNSHRMNIKLDRKYLLKEYCRPYNSPCLQLWDITEKFLEILE